MNSNNTITKNAKPDTQNIICLLYLSNAPVGLTINCYLSFYIDDLKYRKR